MNPDPFGDPGKIGLSGFDFFKKFRGGGGHRPAPKPVETEPEPVSETAEAPAEDVKEKTKDKVILRNPKWECEKVGFNEETDISVEAELPEAESHKTKVDFELFAKTPDGPESISKCQGNIKDGKALGRIPVYIPQYRDEDHNLLAKVEYYFTAKHSLSDLLKDEKAAKIVDEMAERLIETHVLQDVTFATGKSFLRPGQAANLKALGGTVAAWRTNHPEGKLAVFGHADAVGQETHNKALSERRARSIQAFLTKEPKVWEDLYGEEKWGLATSQDLLRHLGYDPGPIDGLDGPRTQEAMKAFQGDKGLAQSGAADSATRAALYSAYMEACASPAAKAKEFDSVDGKPHAGCSEFNLVEKTDGASEPNRRVAVLLLKSSKNFPIQYPCKHGDIGPCRKQADRKGERKTPGFKCFFYDQLVQEKKGGGGKAAKGKVQAFTHSSEKELKRFVNLSGEPDTGMNLDLEVKVEGQVAKVYWKAVAGVSNSKRNDPIPGWVDPKTKKAAALKNGVGEFETVVVDGKAKATFCLGLAGGDEFTFEVGTEKGKKEVEQKVINWRRLWYQLTHHKDITPPSMATAEKKLKDYFIEWVAENPVTHSLAMKGNVIVGNHNAEEYHKLLSTKHPGQCVHIILCDKQYDGLKSNGANHTNTNSKNFTNVTDTLRLSGHKLEIFNPPLQKGAKLILDAIWKNSATGKSGNLTDDPAKVNTSTGYAKFIDKENFEITLPANAAPSVANPVAVALKVTASNGPWGGDGGTAPHNLVVIDSNDIIHSQVVLHELGHIINMVPISGYYKAPPGMKLSDHTLSYTGMGGSGSHCSWETDASLNTAAKNVDGKCIMFHQLNRNCKLVFCPDCSPFVKAQGLLTFHELKG